MKFKVEQQDIAKALNCMIKLMTKLPKDSVLNCVKVYKLNDEYIRLIASNGNCSIRYDINARLVEGESIIYDLNYLTSIVNKMEGELTFNVDVVRNTRSKFKIGHKTQEYPNFVFESDTEKTTIDAKDFINSLLHTSYATTKDSTGILSGVLFNNNDVVATDGNRLVINKLENSNLNMILPSFAVEYISKLFENKINIQCEPNTIIISDDNIVLTVKSLVGQYPHYEGILPKENHKTIKFNKSNILNALNIMSPVLNQCFMIATFKFTDNYCIISSFNNVYEGDTEFKVNSNDSNEVIELTFNCQFILDMCKYFDDDEITMEYIGNLKPVVFRNKSTYCLIMPIQRKM